MSRNTSFERMETTYKGFKNYYILDYHDGDVIDACLKGSDARYVNHSCAPNCRIEKW